MSNIFSNDTSGEILPLFYKFVFSLQIKHFLLIFIVQPKLIISSLCKFVFSIFQCFLVYDELVKRRKEEICLV